MSLGHRDEPETGVQRLVATGLRIAFAGTVGCSGTAAERDEECWRALGVGEEETVDKVGRRGKQEQEKGSHGGKDEPSQRSSQSTIISLTSVCVASFASFHSLQHWC